MPAPGCNGVVQGKKHTCGIERAGASTDFQFEVHTAEVVVFIAQTWNFPALRHRAGRRDSGRGTGKEELCLKCLSMCMLRGTGQDTETQAGA
eukprot:1160876-Pelagomonas_calceolata.AAC.1